MKKVKSHISVIRHSLSHIMALAVKNLFGEKVKFGVGPAIENGFYYDFVLPGKLSSENLFQIEEEMRKMIKENLKFEKKEISITEAKKMLKNQPFKLELIEELKKNKEPVIIYAVCPPEIGNWKLEIGNCFVDLCRGPHVESTKEIAPGAFKLTKIAGAYWRGNEKNPMLVRIYGLAFETEKELKDYLKLSEEAEKRDHRKIGKELDLFSFHEQGPGFAFWHPKGTILYQELENFIRRENKKRGYQEIKTPIILKKDLWLDSGHWEKFKENMYFTEIEGEVFAIKPMNCPGALLIYNEKIRSYKELPLRFSELGLVHRHELSGVLHGLLRARMFTQDDAHTYCAPNQLTEEIKNMIDYALNVYKIFGFDKYDVYIATRPEKYIGEDKIWREATNALKESLENKKIKYEIKKGEGSFYGPKIEFDIKDAIGRNWQMGTIQVDFSMPRRLGAVYIDKDGKKQNPVMVHRAILGSLERFIAILIEHYAGSLPFWLSPVQILILPIGENHLKYAEEINAKLRENGFRSEINAENETLGKKIREGEIQKIPYILIIGEKEIKENKINVRKRDDKSQKLQTLENFIEEIGN